MQRWPTALPASCSALAAASALFASSLAGCGGDEREGPSLPDVVGSDPSAEALVGTWREERPSGDPAFVRFDGDGTFAIDTVQLDVPYWAAGTYELDGNTIAFVANGPDCQGSWEWRVGLSDGGGTADELHVVFPNAFCGQLAGAEHTFARG